MKKICLFLSFAFLTTTLISAQESLKPFKVDLSLGYAIPGGTGAKGGVLFAVEPKYAVHSLVTLGLRMEAAVVARGFSDIDNDDVDLDVKASGSYLLTADHYFSDNYSFRPFAGIGAGIFTMAAAKVDGDDAVGTDAGSKFGGLIRAGFEARHFRLGLEYNLVPTTTFEDLNGGPDLTSKNGYIGIKLGVCIGGGRQ